MTACSSLGLYTPKINLVLLEQPFEVIIVLYKAEKAKVKRGKVAAKIFFMQLGSGISIRPYKPSFLAGVWNIPTLEHSRYF